MCLSCNKHPCQWRKSWHAASRIYLLRNDTNDSRDLSKQNGIFRLGGRAGMQHQGFIYFVMILMIQ
jgi:hypothetical protein